MPAAATLPSRVFIVDVGPRDGLQNEKGVVPTDVKVALIEALADAGVPSIEATSFVSPKWVPQMADAADIMARVRRRPGVRYAALVPNMKGFEGALAANVDEAGLQKPLHCSAFGWGHVCASLEVLAIPHVVVGLGDVPVAGEHHVRGGVVGQPQGDVIPQRVEPGELVRVVRVVGCPAVGYIEAPDANAVAARGDRPRLPDRLAVDRVRRHAGEGDLDLVEPDP